MTIYGLRQQTLKIFGGGYMLDAGATARKLAEEDRLLGTGDERRGIWQ
jgi:hypothetical protein